jgi:predicted nucleotidyltransferase
MNSIGLSEDHLSDIVSVLKANPEIKAATVFGSRAKGTHKPFSDIDIAIHGNCDALSIADTACKLDELPTAFKFDVVAYNSIKNPDLQNHIDRVGVTIYKCV